MRAIKYMLFCHLLPTYLHCRYSKSPMQYSLLYTTYTWKSVWVHVWAWCKCVYLLMLNVANKTVWVSLALEGAWSVVEDRSPWIWIWWDALCFCSVLATDTPWHNQVTEMVKALGYSLCCSPHYSRALFSQRLLKHVPPYWSNAHTHTHTHTQTLTRCIVLGL